MSSRAEDFTRPKYVPPASLARAESGGRPKELGATRISRPTGDPRYFALLDELADLHAKKGADYGTKKDFLANLRASEEYGIPAWVGALLRANDKRKRILAFLENGKLENESLEDSLIDSAAYYLLAVILYRERNTHQLHNRRPAILRSRERKIKKEIADRFDSESVYSTIPEV